MHLWSEMVHAEDTMFFLSGFLYLCVLGSSLVLRAWCLWWFAVPDRYLVHLL